MHDRLKVGLGVFVFVVAAAFPLWRGLSARGRGIDLAPVDLRVEVEGVCVVADDVAARRGKAVPESREERRRIARIEHARLLQLWRDEVVRQGARYRGPVRREAGRAVLVDGPARDLPEKSLSRTCLGCHENKVAFCDRCHDNAGVVPACFSCHVEPSKVAGR